MNTNGEQKKILIIEDERAMIKILSDTFKREGLEVIEAMDGKEGLEKAVSVKPDIILLDIVLPQMDGLTLLRKLRKTDEYGAKVPVILLTNLSPDKDEINNAIVDTDPAYYLVKTNWNTEDIVAKVKERLSRSS